MHQSRSGMSAAGVGPGEPPAAGAALALAVEVHGGDGRAEVVAADEATGVEVVAPRRREHRLPPELPEQHQHHAVDARRRGGGLVAYQLTACMHAKNPAAATQLMMYQKSLSKYNNNYRPLCSS